MNPEETINEISARGFGHLQKNQWSKAAECFGEVLKRKPDHPHAIHQYGVCLRGLQRYEAALQWMEKSIKLRPQVADYHNNLATTLTILGRLEEAKNSYRKALELRPNYPVAWFNYTDTNTFADGESPLPTIENLLCNADLTSLDQEYLHFAAGKVCDDRGEYDKAFMHYREGNRLRGHVFDQKAQFDLMERIRSVFSKAQLEQYAEKKVGSDSEEPVFIVGMPRSGTTLVEQILSSHPQIEGAGELSYIASISKSLPQNAGGGEYPECTGSLPDQGYAAFAQFYLGQLGPLRSEGILRIIDKMPANFLHVGLIRCVFPKARIIHCMRDPRDTCLSCWFKRLGKGGHDYSGDLANLGYYYRLHERLMNHWKAVAPAMIFTLNYGELIDTPEQVTRDLLAFCGVEWDDACLRFHENKRAVSTASNFQVRTPLNRQGLGRWQHYESHLGPLFDALEEFAPLANP